MASQFKTFADGDILTGAEVNSFLMKQAVIVCDSSSDYPTSPNEGMLVYDKALDSYVGYTSTAWVTVAALGAAADLSWSPVVTQSGTVSHTVNEARYIRQGPIVHAWFSGTMTGSGTTANAVSVTLPVTAASHYVGSCIGAGLVYDASAGIRYPAQIELTASTTVGFGVTTSGSAGLWGVFPNAGLASSDALRFQITYTVA